MSNEKSGDKKEDKNIEMAELFRKSPDARDDKEIKKIEDIILEKKTIKKSSFQKRAHKTVGKVGIVYGLVAGAYSGLIGVLSASSNVLNAAGSAIPIVGVAFQLLGTVIGGIGSALDPKASVPAKVFTLFMASVVLSLTAAGFATAGAAAGPFIGFVALGMGVVMGGLQFVAGVASYFSLKKEREVADDVREIIGLELKKQNILSAPAKNMTETEKEKITSRIEKLESRIGGEKLLEKLKILQIRLKDNLERVPSGQQEKIEEILKSIKVVTVKIESLEKNTKPDINQKIENIQEITSPEKKLEQLYQERKEVVSNYVKDMELFKSYPDRHAALVAEGVQNLAKAHRKSLMAIDKQIEEIIKPDAYFHREIYNAKKTAIDAGATFILSLAGVAATVIAVGFPAVVMAFGAAVGVIGFAKLAVNVAVDYQDKKTEKERKEQHKTGIQEEVSEAYKSTSSIKMQSVFSQAPQKMTEKIAAEKTENEKIVNPMDKKISSIPLTSIETIPAEKETAPTFRR